MPEAHFPTRVPGGRNHSESRGQGTGLLRWSSAQQRGGTATQHGIQVGQLKHFNRRQGWIHLGQQDPAGRGPGQRPSQQDRYTGHVQLERITVGRGDRTPSHTRHELVDVGLRRETGVRTVGRHQTRRNMGGLCEQGHP